MQKTERIATRESYGEALLQYAEVFPEMIVLDADLTGATKTAAFQKKYPQRHINCGIAECNMMGVAAGMATMGFIPVVSTFAMFAAGRAYEQVRNSIGYPHLNVKICATHGGISVGEDGASHQCIEDFALMQAIPGMVVLCPSDDKQAKAALYAALKHVGPVYIRFSRMAIEALPEAQEAFEIGKGQKLSDGADLTLVSTGFCAQIALQAAKILKTRKVHVRVLNFPTIKPIDKELLLTAAEETKAVVCVEEHSVIGGLGSTVCSVLSQKRPTSVKLIGVQDVFGESGSAEKLLQKHGLCADEVARQSIIFLQGLC